MEVVITGDRRYVRPLAVAVCSLDAALAPDERCVVHVLHTDLEPGDEADVAAAASLGRAQVVPRRVTDGTIGGYPVTDDLPLANYLRLLAPDIVSADRILYLDADVIVRRSPLALAGLDLGGRTIAAVQDAGMPYVSWWRALPAWRRCGLDPFHPYFNAGVLLVDVRRWRETDVAGRFHRAIGGQHPGRFHVQAPLNQVLAHEWRPLPLEWNVIDLCNGPRRHVPWLDAVYPPDELATAVDDPAVVHLTGSKPWSWGSTNPWADRWYEVLDRTAYAGWRPRRRGGAVLAVLPAPVADAVVRGARRGRASRWGERGVTAARRLGGIVRKGSQQGSTTG